MIIHDVDYQKIVEFIGNLSSEETQYYDIIKERESLKKADLVNGFMVNNKLVGIGGINRYFGIIPHTFYMIKSAYQEIGIGSMFSKENMEYAQKHFPFIITIIEDGNFKAQKIAEHRGFKFAIKRDTHYYYYKYFNLCGKLFGSIFPAIVAVYYFVKNRR
jgi:RimJ/RimL family protein N-acetyltransferase